MRLDLAHIQKWIAPESRVLDLGCGDGEFLDLLIRERQVQGTGLEIDEENITAGVSRGLNIVQQNMDEGLANFPDNSFDTVVMAHALQAVHYPDRVLDEMLRIGNEGIVTFPNFGHWSCRLHLVSRGRMPVSRFMPHNWYDTPNIHHVTIDDFRDFIAQRGIRIEGQWFLRGNRLIGERGANLLAEHAVFLLAR